MKALKMFEDALRMDNTLPEAKKGFNELFVNLDQKIKKLKSRKGHFDEKTMLRFLNENLTHLTHFHKIFLFSGKIKP